MTRETQRIGRPPAGSAAGAARGVSAARRPRLLLLAGGAALGLAYVGVRDPHDPSVLMPRCPLHWATGLNCPACGGLRMTHDLLHGDISAAVGGNAFLLAVLPIVAVLLARAALLRRRGRTVPVIGRRSRVAIIAAAAAWFAVRNLVGW